MNAGVRATPRRKTIRVIGGGGRPVAFSPLKTGAVLVGALVTGRPRNLLADMRRRAVPTEQSEAVFAPPLAAKPCLLGRTWQVSTVWPSRLVRCEVDLDKDTIRFFTLRRKEPTSQPRVLEVDYRGSLSAGSDLRIRRLAPNP
jgi:hypothetical protein